MKKVRLNRPPSGRDSKWLLARIVAIAAAWLVVSITFARAEPRIALVIGNGDYQAISPLANPVSDGRLIAETLESVGFDATLLLNGSQSDIKRAVADFGRRLRSAGPDATGLFYFAGHGVQSRGVNYLLPVDGAIQDEADLDLVGVPADWVLRQLFSAQNRTNIVILDACRDNPFEVLGGMREQGLAEMNAPTGTFIAYASAPGSVAMDGAPGSNSPFTRALSAGMLAKGQPIEQVFKRVRISVLEATEGQQTPWDSSSLTSDFFFEPAVPVNPKELAAQQLWNSVKLTTDPVQIILFLRQYPDSLVSEEARALLGSTLANELGPGISQQVATVESGAVQPVDSIPDAAPAPVEPSQREAELIARAQASGALADYEEYLVEFPAGVFAALATAEIEVLKAAQTAPPAADVVLPEPSLVPEVSAFPGGLIPGGQSITFYAPLSHGFGSVAGRSIAQIIEGSPQYSPIEGLSDNFWKEKRCNDCHNWTRAALCEQGQTYLTRSGEFALEKQHPLDGFKHALSEWAGSGCG
jgi:Caspase domain